MRSFLLALLSLPACLSALHSAPAPSDPRKSIIDRADLIPHRKQFPLPGKIVAVLLADAQPILTAEGRSGPADQLCAGYNAGSYRWVYLPVVEKAAIRNLSIPLPEGKSKLYPQLAMAAPETVKAWGVTSLYSLVELEVNDGAGSPPADAFVATGLKVLDGSKEYPLKVADVIASLGKDYERHLSEKGKDLDAAMEDAAKKYLKEERPTGPRSKTTAMFVTWMPEAEQLHVRFLTRYRDGAYRYANGIKIEFNPPPGPAPIPQGENATPAKLPNGLKFGTEFGIEYGVSFEVSRSGKVDRVRTTEITSFSTILPEPRLGRMRREFK